MEQTLKDSKIKFRKEGKKDDFFVLLVFLVQKKSLDNTFSCISFQFWKRISSISKSTPLSGADWMKLLSLIGLTSWTISFSYSLLKNGLDFWLGVRKKWLDKLASASFHLKVFFWKLELSFKLLGDKERTIIFNWTFSLLRTAEATSSAAFGNSSSDLKKPISTSSVSAGSLNYINFGTFFF